MSTYQPSGAGNAFAANANANASTSNFNPTSNYDESKRSVQYACGDCDAKVNLKRGEAIRCKECGHRVLYKERTTRMVQFEAR